MANRSDKDGVHYKHAEAFCLMTYRSDDGTETEVLWNSRDGATPFVITLRSGKQAVHVDWHKDKYAPDHVPQSGDRIFVNLTEERARELVAQTIQRYETDGTFDKYGRPDNFEQDLLDNAMRPGAPDIKEIE